MLQKPDLDDDRIVACLQEAYGLHAVQIGFLPLGNDEDTAVYRAVADDRGSYFVKLRSGLFDELSVVVPRLLADQGIWHIIPPLPTKRGQLWAMLDAFRLVLYPFVEGRDGYEASMLDHHWRDLGQTVKGIHTSSVPPSVAQRIRREAYSPQARLDVRAFVERAASEVYDEPVAAAAAAFLRARRRQILDLVEHAERLVDPLRARCPAFVLCHSDLHAGNFLITADEEIYLVDWDEIIMAPKERDLMFVGAGGSGEGRTPEDERRLFYQGYGPTEVDPIGLAYYRDDRLVQDIAAFCERILLTDEGGEDRAQALHYLLSTLTPDGTGEVA